MPDTPFAVVPLAGQDRSGFACGVAALDSYLRTQAGQDMNRQVAACFLALDRTSGRIAGYYTLAACHVRLEDPSPDWQRRLPRYPAVPAVRLGRLAIDRDYQGRKLGAALLGDAATRALRAEIAAHMMVVAAKDAQAAAFYSHHGFRPDPQDPLRLCAPLASLAHGQGRGSLPETVVSGPLLCPLQVNGLRPSETRAKTPAVLAGFWPARAMPAKRSMLCSHRALE